MGRGVYTYSEIVVGEESGREIVDRWGEAVLKCLEGFVPAVAMRGSAGSGQGWRGEGGTDGRGGCARWEWTDCFARGLY